MKVTAAEVLTPVSVGTVDSTGACVKVIVNVFEAVPDEFVAVTVMLLFTRAAAAAVMTPVVEAIVTPEGIPVADQVTGAVPTVR